MQVLKLGSACLKLGWSSGGAQPCSSVLCLDARLGGALPCAAVCAARACAVHSGVRLVHSVVWLDAALCAARCREKQWLFVVFLAQENGVWYFIKVIGACVRQQGPE